MGRKELGVKPLTLKKFDLGFFPNKDFDDVPIGGSPDCKHVLYRRSALRPFPGMEQLNTTQASNTLGQGLHYMDVNGVQKIVGVFGNKFYENVGGVWTDRTGTAVIGNGDLVQFIDHQQGANKYLIGYPGNGNPPFKWTGSGDAALLGGSPANFNTGAKYHNSVFGAVNEVVYPSATSDPETILTDYTKPFEKDVVRLIEHGSKLAVMMSDHIGSIQGYDYLDYVAEEKEIPTFGCVGKLAAVKCNWGDSDLKVVATIAKDGLWIFDESFGATKILGDDYFYQFNQNQLSKSSIAYWREENLLFLALPFGSSNEPNYILVVNTKTGAFWPGPDIHAGYIKSLVSARDLDGTEFIYFQDSNGYAFRFNMDANYYHTGTATQEIDHKWVSRRYDLEDVHSLGDCVMLAESVGNWGINVGINFGLENSDGNIGNINFAQDADSLTYSFVLGASALRGSNYIFNTLLGVGGFGRFVQIILTKEGVPSNSVLSSTFTLGQSELGYGRSYRVKMLEVNLHDHRRGGNDR